MNQKINEKSIWADIQLNLDKIRIYSLSSGKSLSTTHFVLRAESKGGVYLILFTYSIPFLIIKVEGDQKRLLAVNTYERIYQSQTSQRWGKKFLTNLGFDINGTLKAFLKKQFEQASFALFVEANHDGYILD